MACNELGFGPAELVDRVTAENLHGGLLSRPKYVTRKNLKCSPKTTRNIETCGSDYYAGDCDKHDTVFIRCAGTTYYIRFVISHSSYRNYLQNSETMLFIRVTLVYIALK